MTRPSSHANVATKVMTQMVLPIGTPNSRFAIGRSVSCQVHHKNFAPVMS